MTPIKQAQFGKIKLSHTDGRYHSDVAWLRARGGQAENIPSKESIRLACEGLFADGVWGEDDKAALRKYLGQGGEVQVCR